MIISHKHKFIFIKTEKTAGTSLEIALSQHCGPEDIITRITPNDEAKRKELGYRGAQNYFIPFSKYTTLDWAKFVLRQRRAAYYNHMSAAEIKNLVSEEIWNSYYKFSFDRNPWDKMISWYYWKSRKLPVGSLDEFVESGAAGLIKGFDLYTIGGVVAVDDVYKYESLDVALENISKKLRLETKLKMPDYVAKGGTRKKRSHYHDLLSPAAAEHIKTIAAREIRLLGYTY